MDHPRIVYTAEVTATGGRQGRARSPDGMIDLSLSTPAKMGGEGGQGPNPELLFAAAYAASLMEALAVAARGAGVSLSDEASVTASVGVGPIPTGQALKVELTVSLPGVAREIAGDLAADAQLLCPVANAIRNNVPVTLRIA